MNHAPPSTADGTALYLAAAESSGNPFFAIDPGIGLWVWIVFFITFLILYKFAWKPILSALEEREKSISHSIESAKKIEENLQRSEENTKRLFLEAQEKSNAMLEAARKRAHEIEEASVAKAREEAEAVINNAKKTIENEREKAVELLRQEATSLSISIAGKLIEENLNDEKNRKLAEKMANNL